MTESNTKKPDDKYVSIPESEYKRLKCCETRLHEIYAIAQMNDWL